MIITHSDNKFFISSDLIETFIAINYNAELKLDMNINCCPNTENVDIILQTSDDPVIARTIEANVMNNQLIIDTTDFKDGVYNFTLTLTYPNGDIQTDTSCVFLDKETKCKVAEYASLNTDNFEAQSLYQALNYIFDCSDCACSDACNIFNKLIKLLTNDDCKCS